jgi:hypothetical protein
MRTLLSSSLAAGFVLLPATAASPESFTPDPERWRPVAYSDLRFPRGEAESYASIWQDRLDESNSKRAPEPLPGGAFPDSSLSYAVGNRGASEWHFTINFQTKLAALTVLDTPNVCTDEYPSPELGVKIKVCPMRLAVFESDRYALVIEGAACFIEKQPQAPIEDSSATRTEVSYDVTVRAFKIRYMVSHVEIPQCAQTVPLHPTN